MKQLKADKQVKRIIIFDGVCHLCEWSVNFILRRDQNEVFMFTPMQSDYAKILMQQYNVAHLANDTVILIKDDKPYFQSDAAIEISREFSGAWRLFSVLKIIPRPIRDFFYRLVAKNRYKLFGKAEACILPSTDLHARFRL